MLTHCAPYLLNGKAYALQTWYTDGGQQPASATGAMTSKVKVTWSVWGVMAQGYTCVIRGRRGIPCHTSCFINTDSTQC